MLNSMSINWWMLVVRGVLAVIFGLLAIFVPGITLTALVLLFGAYVLIDGGVNVYLALTNRDAYERWWLALIEGVIGIIAGILTFAWPNITGLILLYVIAFWAIMTGIMEIVAAIQLRQEISNEWFLGLSGALSIVFGVILVVSPISGALAVSWLIGFYAIMFGGMLIALGLRLRGQSDTAVGVS